MVGRRYHHQLEHLSVQQVRGVKKEQTQIYKRQKVVRPGQETLVRDLDAHEKKEYHP